MKAEITKEGNFKYNIKLNIEFHPYSGSDNEPGIEMMLDYVKQSLLKQYKEDLVENGFKD